MFGRFLLITIVMVGLWALFAHDTSAGGPEQRYRVQPGDTLWAIAVDGYAGDPREAVWRIRDRNDLSGVTLVPGQLLILP